MMTPNNVGPLDNVRVLDLSRVLAAPYATMALGDLGADVIKVERHPDGDETRHWGPPFVSGESTYFLAINRNKRSIALDLRRREDQERVRDLALSWADVVVENFRPGTLEHWGLGLKELRQENPRLITASVRGYPAGDDRPGYDFVIQAGSGLMSITGPEDGPPFKVGVAVSDITTGLFLVGGITSALYRRERTGCGDHVEVSLWGSQLAQLATVVQGVLSTGSAPQRFGNAHAQLTPYQIFPSSDGWLTVAVGNDKQFTLLCRELGHPEWAQDLRFRTNPDRVNHRDALADVLSHAFRSRSTKEWIMVLEQVGVPSGPVRTVPEALDHAAKRGHDVVGHVSHKTLGDLPQVRMPWKFDEARAHMMAGPPLIDQHRDEILALIEQIRRSGKDDSM